MIDRTFYFQHDICYCSGIINVITMIAQVNHPVNAPPGYRTEDIIDVNMIPLKNRDPCFLFAEERSRLPEVKRTAFSMGTPFSMGNNHTMHHEGKNISFQSFVCDSVTFDMLGFQKLRENSASGEAYYLNGQVLRELELAEDATTFPFYGQQKP
ncbi:MAG: hypothetical protein LBT76_00195 [Tannerella sp.]|nr:hypothetical protein [Tannerella sp.]